MNTVADCDQVVGVAAPSWPLRDGKTSADHHCRSWRAGLGHRRTCSRTYMVKIVQGKIYNFLERPTGWKCFIYHFTVYVTNLQGRPLLFGRPYYQSRLWQICLSVVVCDALYCGETVRLS